MQSIKAAWFSFRMAACFGKSNEETSSKTSIKMCEVIFLRISLLGEEESLSGN